MKICKDCKKEKPLSEYSRANSGRSIQSYCKPCASARSRKWNKNITEEQRERKRKRSYTYYHKNSDEINSKKRRSRELGDNEKEKKWYREWHRKKRATDINFKIKGNLRHRIYLAIKNHSKSENTQNLIGCSIEELKNHLQEKFSFNMSWDNYGKWHIDHIKPCASFDLSDPKQQKECFHYSNLQPLWAEDNLKKADKL